MIDYRIRLGVVLRVARGLTNLLRFQVLKPPSRTKVDQVTSAARLSLLGSAKLHEPLTMSCKRRHPSSIEPRISLKRLAEVGVFLTKTLKK